MLPMTITSNCFRAQQFHGGGIDKQVAQFDVRVLLAHRCNRLAPQLHGLEHVGLVHRAHFPLALACGAEGHVRDPFDFGLAVAHGVDAMAPAVRADRDAARLAVVNVAVEFPQDDEVESLDQLGLERRGADELGEHECRAEIGKQFQLAPKREQTKARALVARTALVAGAADRAEQDRVALARERRLRQRHARGRDARAANRRLGKLNLPADECLEDFHRLRGHFLAYAVACHDCDFHDA